jgi:hypothetical protein
MVANEPHGKVLEDLKRVVHDSDELQTDSNLGYW